jgi:hypothetical protein
VIGEETLSSTSVFNPRHSAALFANANSFISFILMGHLGSHLDLTSGRRRQQGIAMARRTRGVDQGMISHNARLTPASSVADVPFHSMGSLPRSPPCQSAEPARQDLVYTWGLFPTSKGGYCDNNDPSVSAAG